MIVIFGSCGYGEDYRAWPVMACSDLAEASRVIAVLTQQATDFHRRFQAWMDGDVRTRWPNEPAEQEDRFKACMLDRDFQCYWTRITKYHTQNVLMAPARQVLEDLVDPNRTVPVVPFPPRCAHQGVAYPGTQTIVDASRCDHPEGHAYPHEPPCANPACCKA